MGISEARAIPHRELRHRTYRGRRILAGARCCKICSRLDRTCQARDRFFDLVSSDEIESLPLQEAALALMPRAKELTVTIPDRPGALGKCLAALAERDVNILAFQSYVEEGESLARFLVDDVAAATQVLGGHSMIFEITEVVTVRLAHRPGELARAAARLGEEKINVNYSYSGVEPGSKLAIAAFGVDNLPKAVAALDAIAAREL